MGNRDIGRGVFQPQRVFRHTESGNILLMLLLAVGLFAALFYVLTQPEKFTDMPSLEGEPAVSDSAPMIEYSATLRPILIRMTLDGTDVSQLKFNAPGNFSSVATDQLVFHPQGGGAEYKVPSPEWLTEASQGGSWYFNADWDVPGVGTDGLGGNDVVAFLPGVSASVCLHANQELALDTTGCASKMAGIPDLAKGRTTDNIKAQMDSDYTFPTTDQEDIQGEQCAVFTGAKAGCFNDTSRTPNEFVFYSVLLAR